MLYLLLKENIDIQELVREHFFVNSFKCWYKQTEHYVQQPYGKAICNARYNVVFPHDTYDTTTIEKFVRRFKRLKEVILKKQCN